MHASNLNRVAWLGLWLAANVFADGMPPEPVKPTPETAQTPATGDAVTTVDTGAVNASSSGASSQPANAPAAAPEAPAVPEATASPAAVEAPSLAPATVPGAAPAQPVMEADPETGRTIQRGTGRFLDEEAAQRREPDPSGQGEVTFNFEAEALPVVIKAILGDVLNENYVIAPGVAGQVTFSTAKPISASQSMGVLEMLLAWNNATLIYKDGRYTVLPVAQALPGNLIPRMGPAEAARGYEVRAVPLKFISATAMQEVLQPYARAGAILKADNTRSMLMIAGTRADLESYLQTVEIFDVDWLAGMSVGVFPLERVEAGTVVPEMEKIFGEGGPTPLAGLFRFMPIERINAVLVITPQADYLDDAEDWLRKLDRGGSSSGSQLFVYYVKNVKATDLATKLTEIFTGQASTSSATPRNVGGVVPGVESVEIKSSPDGRAAPQPERTNAAPARPAADGISIVESEEIRITSIEESNALVIKATPGEYDSILGAIRRLDIEPLQVHIEARVLQVDLSNALSFGVSWFFENSASSAATAAYRDRRRANPAREVWNSYSGGIANTGAVSWTLLNVEAEALISALQRESNVQVLSAPSLVVLNNKDASINVGKQIPVVSAIYNPGGFSNPTTPTTPTTPVFNSGSQSYVQFRDTGITLDVTPRVNPGGLVYLEISQEESTPGESADNTGNVPVDRRTIKTEVAVQSGQTVLLGGLIRETRQQGQGGVPGLSKIPLLGRLFSTSTKDMQRQELLVLITPTVIENAESAHQLTDKYREQFRGLRPLLTRDLSKE